VATWRLPEGELVNQPLKFSGQTNFVEYVPQGMLIAVSCNGVVRLWNPLTNRPASQEHRENWSVAFSPDGKLMATGSAGSPIRVWGAQTSIADDRLLPHDDLILAAEFDRTGGFVITGGQDRKANLWRTKTGEQVGQTLDMPEVVSALAFHPDCKRFAVDAWDGTVQMFATSDANRVGAEMSHDEKVRNVSFSDDGALLFSSGDDGTVRIWDSKSGAPVGEPLAHDAVIRDLAIHLRSGLVMTSVYGGKAVLWDLATRQQRHVFSHPEKSFISSVAINSDGELALTADKKGHLKVWNTESGELVVYRIIHKKGIAAAEFSQSGTKIITGSYDRTARIWDGKTGDPVTPVLQHASTVLSSPDDRLVITGSDDSTAQLWHAESGMPIGPRIEHLRKITVVRFSPSGETVLTAHGTARFTDIPKLELPSDSASAWVEVVTGVHYQEDGQIVIPSAAQWRENRDALQRVIKNSESTRELRLSRLRQTHEGETGPFGQVYRSFSPKPKKAEPKKGCGADDSRQRVRAGETWEIH